MAKVDTILEEIKGLTLLEASDLVKKMEETFGVSAAAATVVAGGGGAAAGAAPAGKKTGMTAVFPPPGGNQINPIQGGLESNRPGVEETKDFWGRGAQNVQERHAKSYPL